MERKSLAILLAIYEPRQDWLIELLDSLNAQTYPNLHLYVRDDASPKTDPARIRELLDAHITAFAWDFCQNEKNLGSNGTFEALLRDAKEDYVAFCDQDDVWLPQKLENTVALLENSSLHPTLVCTNVSVMNGEGEQIAPDMEHHRRRHVFLRGENLAPTFFFRNYVIGCTVVAKRERLLSYAPFPKGIVHDHYLAYCASLEGAIDYLEEPQMRYRVYGGNQTGVMTGVNDKADYYRERIEVFANRMEIFARLAPDLQDLAQVRAWCDARVRNYRREKGGFRDLWRLRRCNQSASLFELFALRMPTPLFRLAVRLVQRRVI